MPNYFQIGPAVFDEKIFKVFPLVALATKILLRIEIFEQL